MLVGEVGALSSKWVPRRWFGCSVGHQLRQVGALSLKWVPCRGIGCSVATGHQLRRQAFTLPTGHLLGRQGTSFADKHLLPCRQGTWFADRTPVSPTSIHLADGNLSACRRSWSPFTLPTGHPLCRQGTSFVDVAPTLPSDKRMLVGETCALSAKQVPCRQSSECLSAKLVPCLQSGCPVGKVNACRRSW